MALSGSFNTTGYEGRYLTLSWTATQSIPNNTSTISWTLSGAGTAQSSWYYAGNFKVVIAGETVYSSATRIQLYNGTTVATGTKTVTHNTDGSKSVAMSAQAGIYEVAVNCSGSQTFTLNTIPRAATITSAPNFTDEENPTITYTNAAGSSATLSAAIYKTDGTTALASYRSISATGTSYTFSLTTTERNAIRGASTTSNTLNVRFYIKTTISGTDYYDYVAKTITIANANPTVTATVTDSNSTTTALTGDSSKFVKGYSNASCSMSATAKKSATITQTSINGTTGVTSKTINGISQSSVVFTATDSRGNTTTLTKNLTMVNYVKLTCNFEPENPTAAGNMSLTISGNYFNSSFGSVSNTLTVKYRYKEQGGSFGSWVSLTATKSGNTYTATDSLTGLDYQKAYVFEAYSQDQLITTSTVTKTVQSIPIFDWSGSDFNFNVPVNFSAGATGITPSGGGGKVYYGTCDTTAGTVAKVVTCSDFSSFDTGAIITVKFTNANTAGTPTMNVNSKGAKYIVKYGTTGSLAYTWGAGEAVSFVYDGTYWCMINGYPASTTYYGVTKLQSSISDTSSTALTPSAVYNFVQSGTWTPSVTGIKSSGSTVKGNYIKIGDVCNINFYFTGTANGGGTGQYIYIAGSSLPFTPATTQRWYAGGGALTNGYCKANYVFTGWCIDTNSSNNIYARTSQQATSANIRGSDYAYQGTNTTNTLYGSGTIQYIIAS